MARASNRSLHGLYAFTPIQQVLRIENLISFHYYEYAPHYSGVVESHDFWEMVYANSGTVQCCAGAVALELKQGQAVFHPPMEQHQLTAIGRDSSTFIISFTCDQLNQDLFRGRIINMDRTERELIATVFAEGQKLFQPPYNQLFQPELELCDDAPYGGMQLLRNALENLMILVQRTQPHHPSTPAPVLEGNARRSESCSYEIIVNSVIAILQANLSRNLLVSDIAQAMNFSSSYLQMVFRRERQTSIMSYYRTLKIETAKKMIVAGEKSFTEISEALGYSSVHHFSTAFRAAMKMTPTEYRNSIQSTGLR